MNEEAKNVGGDDISSTAGDNARNIATGKRIDQDNRSNAANFYNYGNSQYKPERKSRLSSAERLDDLERYVYGDNRSGEPGLIRQAKIQLRWSQANTVLLVVAILVVMALHTAP